ncbi:MAG: hypothetical protein HC795_19070, partial [Coleofasciculaceae cyanobacterium RL_1_1]|nr:hypothetical protein [Coleofasciculaceae cyanobacterium RL_1_1]
MTYVFVLPIVGLSAALAASFGQLRKQQSKYKLLQQKWQEADDTIDQSHHKYDELLTINREQAQRIVGLEQQIQQLHIELKQVDTARQKAKAEVTELYTAIQDDVQQGTQQALNERDAAIAQLEAAQLQVDRVEAEKQELLNQINDLLTSSTAAQSAVLALASQETDFYRQERKQVVLDVLRKELQGMPKGTRREHILADIVDKNPVASERDVIVRKIHEVFHDYQRMTAKIKKVLESIGF